MGRRKPRFSKRIASIAQDKGIDEVEVGQRVREGKIMEW
jgi:hypothetical protein